ncbi:hypothetical protein GEMRC1_001950 [Eukaryota sp. GEM-RC1]
MLRFLFKRRALPSSTGAYTVADSWHNYSSPVVPWPQGAAQSSRLPIDHRPFEDRLVSSKKSHLLWQFSNLFLSGLTFPLMAMLSNAATPGLSRNSHMDLPNILSLSSGLRLVPFLRFLSTRDHFRPRVRYPPFRIPKDPTLTTSVNPLFIFLSSEEVLAISESISSTLRPKACYSRSSLKQRMKGSCIKQSHADGTVVAHSLKADESSEWKMLSLQEDEDNIKDNVGVPVECLPVRGECPYVSADELVWVSRMPF